MDPLTTLLLQRGMGQTGSPPTTQPLALPPASPSVLPASAGKTHTPPETQRFINAQHIMDAIRNNWSPNPILLQAAQRN